MRHTMLALGLLAAASPAALAQPALRTTSPTVTVLDEIFVTATRTGTSSFDALAAVDILGTGTVEATQARTTGDLLGGVANVTTQVGTRANTEQMNMRGLDDRRIGIKVDGMTRSFRGEYKGRTFLSPRVLKRVEVARGGNSVLDGSGAIAGTVQYITRSASDYLEAGETRGATVGATTATNGGMVGGNVAVYGRNNTLDMLAFHETTTSGNISTGSGTELPFSELTTRHSLLKTTWQATDDTAATVTLMDYYDQGDTTSSPIRLEPNDGLWVNRRTRSQNGQLRLAHNPLDNNWVELTALFSADIMKQHEKVIEPGASFGRLDRTDFDEQDIEVYNTSRFSTGTVHHALTVGALAGRESQKGDRPGTNRSQLYPDALGTNTALYAQNEITIGRATLMPGVRYERYELKGKALGVKNSGEKVVGKLAAGYKVTPNTNLYASVAEGYRAPLMFESFASGSLGGPRTLVANPNLKPEESTSYEAGIKHRMFPGWHGADHLTLKGSVFHNKLKNLIERQTITPPFTFGYTNVESAQVHGAEVSADYESLGWFGRATFGVQRGDNKTQNQPLLDIPPAGASLMAGRKGETRLGSWQLAYTLEHAARQKRVPPNDVLATPSQAYTLHGLMGEFRPKQNWFRDMRLNLAVKNLTDEEYRPVTNFINQPGLDIRTGLSVRF